MKLLTQMLFFYLNFLLKEIWCTLSLKITKDVEEELSEREGEKQDNLRNLYVSNFVVKCKDAQ